MAWLEPTKPFINCRFVTVPGWLSNGSGLPMAIFSAPVKFSYDIALSFRWGSSSVDFPLERFLSTEYS